MKRFSRHEYTWSLKLLASLQELSSKKTNAVLEMLGSHGAIQTECRYPDEGLLFAGNKWRAFYHCHENNKLHASEHGHFHIFTDIGEHNWAHVVGLSVDSEGQLLQWFTVNRWVTDGPWLETKDFHKQLGLISVDNKEGLVENWLLALLGLYVETIHELLQIRDRRVQKKLKGRNRRDVWNDDGIYLLASQPIELQSKLELCLLQGASESHAASLNDLNSPYGISDV